MGGDRAESNRCQTDSQSVSGNQHRIRPQRKARESNPQGPEAARFSKPARQAISGYLPHQWTSWESNPSHRSCKDQSPPSACKPNSLRHIMTHSFHRTFAASLQQEIRSAGGRMTASGLSSLNQELRSQRPIRWCVHLHELRNEFPERSQLASRDQQ